MKNFIYKSLSLFVALLLFNNMALLNAQDPINLKITSPSGIDWDIDAIKTANDHGPQIPEDVSGELVKAFDGVTDPTDNDTWTEFGAYCCGDIVNPGDVAGKIAYISRGACTFSLKILNAQKAGAIGAIIANRAPIGLVTGTHNPGLIIMAPTEPLSDSITIPAIFISHEDRLELEQLMDAGSVQATFEAQPMYDATGAKAYSTPLDQVSTLDSTDMQVVAYNRDGDTLLNVVFTLEITDPSGGMTTFTENIDTLLPGKDLITGTIHDPIIQFVGEYTPSEVGTYTMAYSAATQSGTHPLDSKVITKNFEVTDYTFAVDNGVVEDVNGMQFSDVSYAENGGIFGVGSYIYMGSAGGNATHGSFALGNPGTLDLGLGFDFNVKIYSIESNGAGAPTPDAVGTELASVVYSLNGTEVPNELIYVEFPTPVALEGDSIYLMMIEANGFNFSDQIPAYTTAGGEVYAHTASAYLWGTVFESSGFEYWNAGSSVWPIGGRHPMVRLYMEGFEVPVGLELLPEDQMDVFPTLSSDMVHVQFDLTQASSEVFMIVTSTNGQTMYKATHDNIMNETISLDVNSYPTGFYFVTIKTDKGVRTKKFVVAR